MLHDRALLKFWETAFAPPPRLSPSEWAEQNINLPAASNAEPGPLRLTPYQRGMVDAIADDSADVLVYMLASQTGKSISIDCALSYMMAQEPGPILHVSPTEGKAVDFVRSRLDPIIKHSRTLRSIVGGGRKGGGDSLTAKQFPGGSLHVASSRKPDDLAARAIRYLCLDETDRFANSAGAEGCPVTLAFKRTATFRHNRKVIIASTPTAKGSSRIAEWFARGTQERFFVPCPECGAFDYYRFEQLHWTKGKPQTAHLACDSCGALISNKQRLDAIAKGEWRATNDHAEKGVRSFHATELLSKFSSLEAVAAQYEAAEKQPGALRAFHNTVLAEPFDDGTEIKLDAGDLQQRAEPIKQPYPASLQYVVAGADVQAERIEVTFAGIAANDVVYVLNHQVIPGDTSGAKVWQDLDTVLGAASFRTADGRMLPLSASAIDSGYNTTQVANFCAAQRAKSRAVFAVKGVGGFDKPVIRRGNTLKGLTSLHLVGVDVLKAEIHRRLAMQEPGPGFIHLPDHVDPAYFDGLTLEALKTKFVRGYARQEFHMTARSGGGNEPLDCLAYGLAIASITRAPDVTKKQTSIADGAARLNALNNAPAQPNGASTNGRYH